MNLSGYDVKIAESKDATKVLALLKDVANWLKHKGLKQWESVLHGKDDADIIAAIEHRETYMVKKDDLLVATFTLYPYATSWDEWLWQDAKQAVYLHKLAIIPAEAGKGLGKQILHWVENELRNKGGGTIRLDCVAENEKLNHFYRENGYRKMGIRHGFSLYEKQLIGK